MASTPEKTIEADEKAASPSTSSVTNINEKALLRKLDYRLLPPLTILYLLSFLDRSNGTPLSLSLHQIKVPKNLTNASIPTVGNARLEGMATEIHMCRYHPPLPYHIT